jgi:hypothetical protein
MQVIRYTSTNNYWVTVSFVKITAVKAVTTWGWKWISICTSHICAIRTKFVIDLHMSRLNGCKFRQNSTNDSRAVLGIPSESGFICVQWHFMTLARAKRLRKVCALRHGVQNCIQFVFHAREWAKIMRLKASATIKNNYETRIVGIQYNNLLVTRCACSSHSVVRRVDSIVHILTT